MSKTNSFLKHLKNINNFINSLLEKNLNKLNSRNLSNLFRNNKIILIFVALFIVFLSYLLSPTFYKQSDIARVLNYKLQSKFDVNLKFTQNISYNIFPKPHFITNESIIYNDEGEISKIKKLKVFVSLDNLMSINKIKVKDLILENANFNLNKENFDFFLNLMSKSFKDGNLIIKNSNIFYRNLEDEVLFINKIIKMKYYYDEKEIKNIFYSDNEIFNIPFSIESFFNKNKNKIFSQIHFNFMKIKIDNELTLNHENIIGKSDLTFNKFKRIAEYQIQKNYFNFHIFDKKDEPNVTYKGKFNLKPFYSSLDGNLDEINLNYLFSSNAIIAELLKTQIFNNKNINFNLNILADNVYNNMNFRNIDLKFKIKDGLFDTDNTKFEWRNFAEFELLSSLIFVRNGELILDGKLKINVNNYKEIYKFLLTPKNYRNKINQIDLNFIYNFDKKIAELKDIKIDNKINQNVNKILNNVILKKDDLQNKIYFKKLLNEAIKTYAG